MICHTKNGQAVIEGQGVVSLLEELLRKAKDAHSEFEANFLNNPDPLWPEFYATAMAAMLHDKGYAIVNLREQNATTEPITFPVQHEDEADLDAKMDRQVSSLLNTMGREL